MTHALPYSKVCLMKSERTASRAEMQVLLKSLTQLVDDAKEKRAADQSSGVVAAPVDIDDEVQNFWKLARARQTD